MPYSRISGIELSAGGRDGENVFAPEEVWMTSDFARRSYGSFGKLGPGSRIAGYLIEEQIGAGGMGAVFRARDEVLGRLAAVKIIAPSAADDEEFRARFLRESRIAAAVDSPHIIPVYGAGEAEGLLYIATRFVLGGDLEALRRRFGGLLAPARAGVLMAQVASALDTAHAAGLVHRDVKPQNILVESVPGQPGHAFLSDFGLSKGAGFSTGLTVTGQFVGTPGFCAPEQIRGGPVDGRADQYALGCVAFVLLTGELVFRRGDTMAMLYAHVHDPMPPLSELRPELPPAVDDVIARALAKSPADRYSRCGEFAAALQQALSPAQHATALGGLDWPVQPTENLAVPGGSARYASRVTSDGDSAGHGGGSSGEGRGRGRGKVRAIWAAGTAAVLAAGIGAAVVVHVLSPRLGLVGNTPSQPAASRVGSRPALSAASSGAKTGNVIASRVLAKGNYGFEDLTDIAADGTHIWVASYYGNSVTELNAGDGNWLRTLSGGTYGFNHPTGIAADGTHIWVANSGGNSVTELSAGDGSWVRTLSGGKYGFSDPTGIAAAGSRIWVTDSQGKAVTELNASDGSWVRTLSGGKYDFDGPYDIAVDGAHIWVGNYGGNSVTELNAGDGSWVRTLSGGAYGLSGPYDIVADGAHIWVANNTGKSVTELNASDGTWVQTLSAGNYGFNYPTGIAADGGHIWITNNTGNSVTELNASDGSWVRTLSGGTYGFNHPYGIAADGAHIWVANNSGHSVTELTTG
jgi:hypothetical protein